MATHRAIPINPLNYKVVGGLNPPKSTSANLVYLDLESQTLNGLTITVNDARSYFTIDGTATAETVIDLPMSGYEVGQTYTCTFTVNGSPSYTMTSQIIERFGSHKKILYTLDPYWTSEVVFDDIYSGELHCVITIPTDTVCSSVVVFPTISTQNVVQAAYSYKENTIWVKPPTQIVAGTSLADAIVTNNGVASSSGYTVIYWKCNPKFTYIIPTSRLVGFATSDDLSFDNSDTIDITADYTFNGCSVITVPDNVHIIATYITTGSTEPICECISALVPIGEHQLSPTEPTTRVDGSVLQVGDIWIKTEEETALTINLLKKNAITSHIFHAMQWDGTAWQYCDLQVFKDGEWVTPYFFLFSAQYGIRDTSGAWKANGTGTGDSSYGSTAYNDSYMRITSYSTSTAKVGVLSVPIDLTNFNTVRVNVSSCTGESSAYVGVNTSATNVTAGSSYYKVRKSAASGGIIELDVSSLTGVHYFKGQVTRLDSSANGVMTITEVVAY